EKVMLPFEEADESVFVTASATDSALALSLTDAPTADAVGLAAENARAWGLTEVARRKLPLFRASGAVGCSGLEPCFLPLACRLSVWSPFPCARSPPFAVRRQTGPPSQRAKNALGERALVLLSAERSAFWPSRNAWTSATGNAIGSVAESVRKTYQ